MLGLSPGQQTDVIEEKARTALNRTQAGIKLALKYWLERVLAEGTFRALLVILLSLDKGDVAIKVAQYLSTKVRGWVIIYSNHAVSGITRAL